MLEGVPHEVGKDPVQQPAVGARPERRPGRQRGGQDDAALLRLQPKAIARLRQERVQVHQLGMQRRPAPRVPVPLQQVRDQVAHHVRRAQDGPHEAVASRIIDDPVLAQGAGGQTDGVKRLAEVVRHGLQVPPATATGRPLAGRLLGRGGVPAVPARLDQCSHLRSDE